MNKKISTFWAMFIILVSAILFGTASFFYLSSLDAELQIDTWQKPSKKLLGSVDYSNNWPVYKSDEYGFELKYPEVETKLQIMSKDEILITLPIVEKGLNTNIDGKNLKITTKPKTNGSDCVPQNYYSKTDNISIDGVQFVRGEGGEGAAGHGYQYVDYTTSKNNTCITFAFTISSINDLQMPTYSGGKPYTPYDFSKEEPIFSQIISTFKLINQTPGQTVNTTNPVPLDCSKGYYNGSGVRVLCAPCAGGVKDCPCIELKCP